MPVDFRHRKCGQTVLRWMPDDRGPRRGTAMFARDWRQRVAQQWVPVAPGSAMKCPACGDDVYPTASGWLGLERVA